MAVVAGSVISVGLFVLSLLIFQLWMKYFHLLPGTRKLVLQGSIDQGAAQEDQSTLEGRRGAALTDIAPSGKASIDDQRFDVVAESLAIPKGSEVEFVRRSGPSWVVRQA